MRPLGCALALWLLASCGADAAPPSPGPKEVAAARAEEGGPPPPEVERPYDEEADAQAEIDAALARAREDDRRVLLLFGANWCVWCRRLDYVLRHDPGVSEALASSYHLVHVDVGTRESSAKRALARRYGDPVSHGLPCFVVLDADGSVAHVQETGSLEDGDHHDPSRVRAFLDRWSGAG